jgi:motility quorum-sensing regulator/GCU-specific mRNA interferase toxin
LEKKKPHHDLAAIKVAFSSVAGLRMTKTAQDCALGLNMTLEDVVGIVRGLTRSTFYKSMTSEADSTVWQDVYHPTWNGVTIYLKFTRDPKGHLIISLKEK